MTPTLSAADLEARLRALADPARAAVSQRFFKTGPGGYGEGDRFLGIAVPVLRRLAREGDGFHPDAAAALLESPWHEARLLALLLLMRRYARAGEAEQEAIHRLYLARTRYINNWDLVDISAPHLVGAWLAGRPRAPLYALAASDWLWDRRIAILATLHFIRLGDFADTLRLAEIYLAETHDLMHKATGWMLREVGKRDAEVLRAFLARHAPAMPRTMLRYAIERLPESERRRWLGTRRMG